MVILTIILSPEWKQYFHKLMPQKNSDGKTASPVNKAEKFYKDFREFIKLSDKVPCMLCGKHFHYVMHHINSTHNVNQKEYDKMFPLAPLHSPKMVDSRSGVLNYNYGKSLSDETKRKISENRRGISPQFASECKKEEWKRRLSESQKGKIVSAETRRKMSEAHKGKKIPLETRKKMSEAMKGRVLSEEHKRKLSESRMGEKNPRYGASVSAETRKKMSDARIGIYTMENHPSWKGGTSFEPYGPEFNEALKVEIRERDNYICQWCGKTGKCAHHIDGDHKNNEKWNLIILCGRCNLKEQFQREKLMPYFYSIVKTIPPDLPTLKLNGVVPT